MNIIEMSPADLIPYEMNPRKNDDAVDAVALSISSFGFKVPIIIDSNNVIVAGHTRLKAAQKLGLSTVPVIRADDLTEEQVRAFRLADNKVSEAASWDFEKLEAELANIDMDMSLFGFLDPEDGIDPDTVAEDDPDLEGGPVEPRAQRGDIFQLGEHRLMCGDSTDPEDVAALMDGATVKLLLTDPPYNVALGVGDTPEVAKKRSVLLWALMPLTRPIDTLVITLNNANSEIGKMLKQLADIYPDFIEWNID